MLRACQPWLYQNAYKAFNDITSGSSAGCNTSGFPAEVGWDAVTGWGTPVSWWARQRILLVYCVGVLIWTLLVFSGHFIGSGFA